ncbi:MAG: aminopeptidase P N-terminal domain-containing protein [Pseudanabaenaceae cyanobacterium]
MNSVVLDASFAAELQRRRQRLYEKLGDRVAVVGSAPAAVHHNDVEFPYRQDSDFFYLTGLNEPEAVALFAPQHPEHRFVLFVRPRDPEAERWVGKRLGVEGAKEIYGADAAYPIAELPEKLPLYLEKASQLCYSFGGNESLNATVLQVYRRQVALYARRGTGVQGLLDLRFLLAPLRQHKSPWEVAKLRQAIHIAAIAHANARQMARPGVGEWEIEAQLAADFRRLGGQGPAYPSIVAGGANACILHYTDNNCRLQDGDLLLIDAGCSYDYYNSDITRTFPVNGRFTAEQRAIYDIVLRAQQAAIAEVKPGAAYNQPHEAAVRVIVEGLRDLGLLVGDTADLMAGEPAPATETFKEQEEREKRKPYKPFFLHRTGHFLGLDVHDVGNYREGEGWTALAPGMVITIEPGIYIAPDLPVAAGQPEVPERWHGIGIRIEDDVLVTDTGCEVLTAAVPKLPAELTA